MFDVKNAVFQLPIYPDGDKEPSYKFVTQDPLPLQKEISTLRKAYAAEYQRISEQFEIVDKTLIVHKHSETKSYVETEWTVLPKAAAITVGGMAGFVLGLKRGYIGRALYTAFGLATMGAFCYPYETVDLVREGIRYSGRAWEQFQNPKVSFRLSPPLWIRGRFSTTQLIWYQDGGGSWYWFTLSWAF
ncbi:unnamed protein product [Angiostrongylus costaricensis]|uniref:MICOS complex subunit n=1 Tax=Angiostrongylus costaricensis TaxID=334426 RepID=A0A0R3PQK4_ANGCS|nr:unnamed protein product [Angiostrongylus costaricensis]